MNRVSPIASGRRARLLKLGRLAGGMAAGMAAEGFRQLSSGRLPVASDLLLTPGNAVRLAERLSEMRGAAMKLGQLLSMEAGDLLPPELTGVLAGLRDKAHSMPVTQLAGVLERAWGEDWKKRFRRFSFQPIAAASIGQVHEAVTRDGRHLAVKVQYPGVGDSIDSDLDNVSRLLGLFRLVPEQVDIGPLLKEAKSQLRMETDYLREARSLQAYAELLGDHPLFIVPEVVRDLTTAEVLSMSHVGGHSLELLQDAPSRQRKLVASELMALAAREIFDWGLVQTDPNFANFRYDAASGRIGLVDFGALRAYSPERAGVLRGLLGAAVAADRSELFAGALAAGYIGESDPAEYRNAVLDLLLDAAEPARLNGEYDFGGSGLAARMSEKVVALRLKSRFWRMPPVDLLYLHRKLGGLYMLCARFRVRVAVREIVLPYLDDSVKGDAALV